MPDSFLLVLTTLPNRAQAEKLSRQILKERLAACINSVKGLESLFWWDGKIDRAKETLLLIKTRTSCFNRLRVFIEKHHPYSVPEIIAVPIRKGNASYLKWLQASVR